MKAPAEARFRAHRRRKVHLRAIVTRPIGESALEAERFREREADVLDLGLGGACLALRGDDPHESVVAQVPIGERVQVALVAPALWDPLLVPARLVWSTTSATGGVRLGVAFEPLDGTLPLALFHLEDGGVFRR